MEKNTETNERFNNLSVNQETTTDCVPIVLIDNSGSTGCYCNAHGKNVLKREIDISQQILKNNAHTHSNVIFWNDRISLKKESVQTDKFVSEFSEVHPAGSTDVSVAIHAIPSEWISKDQIIYVVTDGQTYDGKYSFSKQMIDLSKKDVNMYIVSVSRDANNYYENDINAGSSLYEIVQQHSLSKYIRSFVCYNGFHKEDPFVNYNNPIINKDQFLFSGMIFRKKDFVKFIDILSDVIEQNKNSYQFIDKLLYDLSFTLYSYAKDLPEKIQKETINMITHLFENTGKNSQEIHYILQSQIIEHEKGKSKTFRQYITNRTKLFERTQDDLHKNVSGCFGENEMFFSIPIRTSHSHTVKIVSSNAMNTDVHLGSKFFGSGGVKCKSFVIPMFPTKTLDAEHTEQAMRQWIRAIYSEVMNINASDESILYLFLTDMMSIVLSDEIPEKIKNGYRNCSRILLNARRFNSGGVKQIEYLMNKNSPELMEGSRYLSIHDIFSLCKKRFNSDIKISNDDFWYAICCTYGDVGLMHAQLPKNFNIKKTLDLLRENNKDYFYHNLHVDCQEDLDYHDYITLEDTTDIGGYKLPPYKIGNHTYQCKFVISDETCEYLKTTGEYTQCPISNKQVKLSSFQKVLPKGTHSKDDSQEEIIEEIVDDFSEQIFNSEKFEKVDLIKFGLLNIKDLKLYPIDDCDFTNYPYEFINSVPVLSNKLHQKKIKYTTSNEFYNQVKLRYNWLTKLNINNVAIAGGFCRSLMMDEEVNDIDIFMYGLDNKKEYLIRLVQLVRDVQKSIEMNYANTIGLYAYKEKNNVYEMIFFKGDSDTDIQNIKLEDLSKVTYLCKVQIIMRKHNELKDIINNFDLDASCVAWDGRTLYFNDRSFYAYKYFVNVPRTDKYSDMFDARLVKYYNHGFRIGLSKININDVKKSMQFNINKCSIWVDSVDNNNIYVQSINVIDENGQVCNTASGNGLYNSTGGALYNSVSGESTSVLSLMYLIDNKKDNIHYKFVAKGLNKEKLNVFNGEKCSISITENKNPYTEYNWYCINKGYCFDDSDDEDNF